ncbi:unnamed protein product, partial [Rodentolepis nana]|uniref:Zinc finger protein 358 n=1 Tax=Rodentolepis nana TaxID=102285 RepID=A0A0R3TEK2_RODNA
GFDGEQNLSSVECFQRCETSSVHNRRRHHHLRLTDDGDDDGRVSVVMVEEEEDEDFTSEEQPLQVPSTSQTLPSVIKDLRRNENHLPSNVLHHQRRRRGRSKNLRGRRPLRHCKSRDDEDLEEWLEEGPRSLLAPRLAGGGMSFHQTELVSIVGQNVPNIGQPSSSSQRVTHSDEGSIDLPTVTTEGLDSTESLIESLTFQSTAGSAGDLGQDTSSPVPLPSPSQPLLSPLPPPTPPPHAASLSTSMDAPHVSDETFADWQWLPATSLIAHEGGVGVGVIPLY